eukprot:1833775-Ditylum_brightwellii.AAC.1
MELPTQEEEAKMLSMLDVKKQMSDIVKLIRSEAGASAEGCGDDDSDANSSSSKNNALSPLTYTSSPPKVIDTSSLGYGNWFPLKLHMALDLIEADGQSSIISWQPHGRA